LAPAVAANPAGVDEMGMKGVEEVLRRLLQAATHLVVHPELIHIFLYRAIGQWRGRQHAVAHPDQAVCLQRLQRLQQPGGAALVETAGGADALPGAVETPAVVGALDRTVAHATGAEWREAVRTAIRQCRRAAVTLAKQHQRPAMQHARQRSAGAELAAGRQWPPVRRRPPGRTHSFRFLISGTPSPCSSAARVRQTRRWRSGRWAICTRLYSICG